MNVLCVTCAFLSFSLGFYIRLWAQLSTSPDGRHHAACEIFALADVIGFQKCDMWLLILAVIASTVLENPNCDTPQVLCNNTNSDVPQLESGSQTHRTLNRLAIQAHPRHNINFPVMQLCVLHHWMFLDSVYSVRYFFLVLCFNLYFNFHQNQEFFSDFRYGEQTDGWPRGGAFEGLGVKVKEIRTINW